MVGIVDDRRRNAADPLEVRAASGIVEAEAIVANRDARGVVDRELDAGAAMAADVAEVVALYVAVLRQIDAALEIGSARVPVAAGRVPDAIARGGDQRWISELRDGRIDADRIVHAGHVPVGMTVLPRRRTAVVAILIAPGLA